MFTGKRILLGVTGGIAAYKSALLVRELVRAGAEVQVIMTRAATQFITPLTMSTLSRREVVVEMFPASPEDPALQSTKHIELALWGDVMLIAPASANTIAKIAHGTADNFLTTLVLALRCPLAVAPAMDMDMYLNETTQRNVASLREVGCHIIDPEIGELASGLSGPGRLPEVDRLLDGVGKILAGAHRDLAGKNVLVTAGPTHEPIDPVRYVGNRSSGKMGFAMATAAAHRGANVTLIAGPVALRTPRSVRRIDVQTAREMAGAVEREFPSSQLLVMAAAVADFAPAHVAEQKIKRSGTGGLTLELTPNPDILRSVAKRKKGQIVVGFALETEHGEEHARAKLKDKQLDLIVLNNPREEGAAFGADTNIVTLISPDGEPERLPQMAKIDVAHAILSRAAVLLK
ncbi:MAG: bifunctional phosphopantothenoylcysteine decarboxylase/phosphopantothenate--cysteine ligase CoaBC [Bacteroidota bacterium]